MATPALDGGVRVEAAGTERLDQVMRVMESAFGDTYGEAWTRSQLSGILPMTGVFLHVAVDDATDAVVGFSLFRTVQAESELLLIAVAPSEQRRGVGKLLLDEFLERARGDKVERVHLEVRDGNTAVSMYRAANFQPVGRRHNYYRGSDGSRHDAITLARDFN